MKTLFLCFSLLLLIIPNVSANEHDYIAPYEGLLQTHLTRGKLQSIPTTLVDYAAWKQDARHTQALNALQQIDPNRLSDKDALAFWINAYNLLTIDLIITKDEQNSIKKIGGFFINPWKGFKWEINNKHYTLDDIEHKILRPMGEPRIHMAINCASLSCPDLRAEAYRAEVLDRQLDEQVIDFITNPTKGVQLQDNKATLSKIFSWFGEDFGKDDGIRQFITAYHPDATDDVIIDGYLDYNWSLNGTW